MIYPALPLREPAATLSGVGRVFAFIEVYDMMRPNYLQNDYYMEQPPTQPELRTVNYEARVTEIGQTVLSMWAGIIHSLSSHESLPYGELLGTDLDVVCLADDVRPHVVNALEQHEWFRSRPDIAVRIKWDSEYGMFRWHRPTDWDGMTEVSYELWGAFYQTSPGENID